MISNLAAGLIVVVKDRATRTLSTIGKGFKKLKGTAKHLSMNLNMIAMSLQMAAMSGMAVVGAFGLMTYKAASFEKQMGAVRAVMLGASQGEMDALEKKIKQLGATTEFTATQAAQGAELLARAGFNAQEQIAALGDVLAAAAAEGIPMATSANIIANNVRAFGLEAKDAGRVADVLAITSARTNTTMVQLGEGLRYVASTAAQLGRPIEEVSMALGLVANAGLQGSIGGTSLNNMLLKLTSLSDDAKIKFKKLGIEIRDSNDNLLPIPKIMENLSNGIGGIHGNLNRTAFLMDVFGIRGQKAAANLATAFTKMSEKTENGTNAFEKLRLEIENADGAAQKMAEIRLNNLAGAFTLLTSAMEGASIEFMSPILLEMASSVRTLADSMGFLAAGMQNVDDVLAGRYKPEIKEGSAVTKDAAMSLAEFGAGLRLAADDIAYTIRWLNDLKEQMIAVFGQGGEGGSMVGMGKFVGLATAATVAVIALASAAGMLLAPVAMALFMSWEAVLAVMGLAIQIMAPVIGMFALLALFVFATKKEGQSFGDRFIEIFESVRSTATWFFAGFKNDYMTIMAPIIDIMQEKFVRAWDQIKPIFVALSEAFGMTGQEAAGMGETLGTVLGALSTILMLPVFIITELLIPTIGFLVKNSVVPMIESIGMIGRAFIGLLSGTKSFKESFTMLLKGIAGVIINTILLPFKMVIIAIMEAAGAIGAVSSKTVSGVKGFLNIEPGTLLGRPANDAQTAAAKATTEAHQAQKSALESGYKDPAITVTGQQETTVKGKIKNDICLNGKNLSIAKSEHEFELSQRGGFSLNPFQQQAIISNGGVAAGGTG